MEFVGKSALKWLTFGSLVIGGANAACYLEDASATCAVCWKTTSHGVTTMTQCPEGAISIWWETELPETLDAGIDFPAKYKIEIDTTKFPVVEKYKGERQHFLSSNRSQWWKLPHSNIHSCIRNRGACTPFVPAKEGLAIHTPELRGKGTYDGDRLIEMFETTINLPEGEYTIMLHGRFYVPDTTQQPEQDCYRPTATYCLTKYDIATGIIKSVVSSAIHMSSVGPIVFSMLVLLMRC